VINILDQITALLKETKNRDKEGFRVLRQALGYCWSVAVVALPERGKQVMERWFTVEDRDVRWIMRENLRKNRLARMDAKWVEYWKDKISG